MGQIHVNLFVGRDGEDSVRIYQRNNVNPDDTGLWVGEAGGRGLCQIGDEFSGIMGVSTIVLRQDVTLEALNDGAPMRIFFLPLVIR